MGTREKEKGKRLILIEDEEEELILEKGIIAKEDEIRIGLCLAGKLLTNKGVNLSPCGILLIRSGS